jgi:hypothetical protein
VHIVRIVQPQHNPKTFKLIFKLLYNIVAAPNDPVNTSAAAERTQNSQTDIDERSAGLNFLSPRLQNKPQRKQGYII